MNVLNGLQLVNENVYIRLFHADWFRVRPLRWNLTNVQDTFWRFYMNDCDGAFLEHEHGSEELRARQLYFVPAGVRFSTRATRELNQFYIHFDVLGLHGFIAREVFNRPVCLPPSRSLQRAVIDAARELKSLETIDLALHLRLQSLIYEGLSLHLRSLPAEHIERYQQMKVALQPVLPAIRHIEENLATPLSNRDLAQRCHMGESYFIRRFRECVNQTPAQYIVERRVKTAAQHLLFSDDSIERIATESGFGNRFYFTRVFSRHVGTSPVAYRKNSRV